MGKIICLTSGGVDSIILTWGLAYIFPEHICQPLYLQSKLSGAYWKREQKANMMAYNRFHDKFPNVLEPTFYGGADVKVSRGRTKYRNQIYIDTVVRLYGDDPDVIGMSMGVTPGWSAEGVHAWSLAEQDHDPSFLEEYLKKQKPDWNFFSYHVFTPYDWNLSEKSGRLLMGIPILGTDWIWERQACQLWFTGEHRYSYLGEGILATGGCGRCHSCVGTFAAITYALGYDKTPYRTNPLQSRWFPQFAVQYKSLDLFLKALPFNRDGVVRRELKKWRARENQRLTSA